MTTLTPAMPEEPVLPLAIPQVIDKLVRLAQTPDILGAFLLKNGEVVTGRCLPKLDERVLGRTLSRLANIQFDIEGMRQRQEGFSVGLFFFLTYIRTICDYLCVLRFGVPVNEHGSVQTSRICEYDFHSLVKINSRLSELAKNGLLHVKAILSLIKEDGLGRSEHRFRNFFTGVGRHAMH